MTALCLILAQISLSSCEEVVEVPPVEEKVPLQVGNEWVYELSYYDTLGNVLNTSYQRKTVLNDTIIQNDTWFVMNDGQLVRNSSDGYVYYNLAGRQPVIIYPSASHGQIGYRYEYPHYSLWVLTTPREQASTLNTSLGELSCSLFTISNEYLSPHDTAPRVRKQEDYVSPGIGLVRTNTYYIDSNKLQERRELISYTLR